MSSLVELCRIEPAMEIITGKWKTTILMHLLFDGTKRFSELQRDIHGITKKILTAHLRELEEQDIVRRVVYPVVPPKVEYSLTEYGMTLEPILHLLSAWGRGHAQHMEAKISSQAAPVLTERQ